MPCSLAVMAGHGSSCDDLKIGGKMISLEHVTKSYTVGVPAVKDLNLQIEKGEFVFVVGNSGSGKSTLLKLLIKELEPTEGRIVVNGQELNTMKRKQIPKFRRGIGFVYQDFRLLKDRNVYENIAFAQRVIQTPGKQIKRRVPAMLSMIGLAEKYRSFPKELSGGEQQRVALARALVNDPNILLADEPTGALDQATGREIMALLGQLNENGQTIVIITHDAHVAEQTKRVVRIEDGVLKEEVRS